MRELTLIEQAYRILGVPPESSPLRIKREYRRLAKLWHPDRFPQNTPEQWRAAERMRAINDAYQAIKHAPLRYNPAARIPTPEYSGTPEARRRPLVTDKLEYAVRFACGFLFGILVGFGAVLANTPLAIVAIIPFATGAAAVILGDRFWYWVLELSWAWW